MSAAHQRFCEQCGTPISATAKFCGNCGAPIAPTASPVAEAQSAVSSAISILAVIPSIERKKGLFGAEAFNLIVTAEQLIFASVTPKLLQRMAKEVKQAAKSQGAGFFGQWGAMMKVNDALCDRYHHMSPDTILQQYPNSFVIPTNQVQKIHIENRGFNYDDDGNNPDRMIIHTTSGKMKFVLKGIDGGQTKKRLQPLFGKRLK